MEEEMSYICIAADRVEMGDGGRVLRGTERLRRQNEAPEFEAWVYGDQAARE